MSSENPLPPPLIEGRSPTWSLARPIVLPPLQPPSHSIPDVLPDHSVCGKHQQDLYYHEAEYAKPPVRTEASSSALPTTPLHPIVPIEPNSNLTNLSTAPSYIVCSQYSSRATLSKHLDDECLTNAHSAILTTQPSDRTFSRQPLPRLIVRQQPVAARACVEGDRDRVIDPPPILQLVYPSEGADLDQLSRISAGGIVAQASIRDETGEYDMTIVDLIGKKRSSRLMGITHTTGFRVKDDKGEEEIFFPFHDLSCRITGRYRLSFCLVLLDLSNCHVGTTAPIICHALSNPFDVLYNNNFPGMTRSSPLVIRLRNSGCAIPIRNGNRSIKKKS